MKPSQKSPDEIMAKVSIFGVISNVQMLIQTLFRGTAVGEDALGNKYYKGSPREGSKRERRWVIYKDEPEASLVPPEWHGWLHHQTDAVPAPAGEASKYRKSWQQPPQANLTGTDAAYLPPGHALKGGRRDAATGDYTPWQPPQ
jgi:NADH:ubiquinone oxidoreductase subunit